MSEAPYTYNLTDLVGRRSDEGRTMIVASFEAQKRHLLIFAAAFLPALIVALVFGKIIGIYAVLVFAAVEAVAFVLLERRTNDGLHLRTYAALNDRRTANTGKVFVCGKEVDPARVELINVVGATVPVRSAAAPAPAPAAPRPASRPGARSQEGPEGTAGNVTRLRTRRDNRRQLQRAA